MFSGYGLKELSRMPLRNASARVCPIFFLFCLDPNLIISKNRYVDIFYFFFCGSLDIVSVKLAFLLHDLKWTFEILGTVCSS